MRDRGLALLHRLARQAHHRHLRPGVALIFAIASAAVTTTIGSPGIRKHTMLSGFFSHAADPNPGMRYPESRDPPSTHKRIVPAIPAFPPTAFIG